MGDRSMNTPLIRWLSSGLVATGTLAGVFFLEPTALSPSSGTFTAAAHAQETEEEVNVRVYRESSPAVVSIENGNSTGSGVILSADGLVLTNAHVVDDARTVTVVLADGRREQGDVIAFGEGGLDLAAIRLRNARNLPTLQLAESGSVQVGQRAFAIGNPFGQFQNTFTIGIVSRVDPNRGLIQTDAAINPGNSGGPLLNSQGEVVGINSAIFSPAGPGSTTGIGFAIATDRVASFLAAVRNGTAPRTPQQSPLLGGGRTAQRITLDGAIRGGVLDESSSVLPSDGSFFDAYTFEGQAGQRVEIFMSSDEVNAYLILLEPSGDSLAQDDNSGGAGNARLRAVLPRNGVYTILANTRLAGETGRYQIEVSALEGSPSATSEFGELILQEQGALGPSSQVWPEDGSLFEEYQFVGQRGQTVTITMESTEFDTYIMLFDERWQIIGQNNDGSPGTTNATLVITLPQDGVYRVIANALDNTGRGRFLLTVR